MCRAGKIDGQQIGRAWLVSKESVLAFVREQEERKRVLAESLSKAREVEYQKVVSETVKDVVEPAEIEVVKEVVQSVAPVPRHVPITSVPSPYASKIAVFTRQVYALALTIVILGASSAVASSGLIASFVDTSLRLATSIRGIESNSSVSSPHVYAVAAPEPVDILAFGSAMLTSADVLSAPAGFSAFTLIEERTAFVPDPSANLAHDAVVTLLDPLASVEHAKRAYLAHIDGSGSSLLSIGVFIRDGVATLPATYLSFGNSFAAGVTAVQDAYEHGVYAWAEGAHDVPAFATESALALGRNISSSLATGIHTAPLAYERSVTDFSEASRTIAHQALTTELAIGTSFGSLAYDAGLIGTPAREDASKTLAAEEQELAYVEEEPIVAVAANAGLASPFAAFPSDAVSLLPSWFLGRAQYLARATYGSFSAFFDWAGYAVATFTDPYTNRFPIVMVDYPRSGTGAGTTNIISTGTSTVVQNIYQNQFTEGASIAYVDTWVARLQRAINTNAENQNDGGGGGITSVSGDIHVNSLIVDTTGAFAGALSAGNTTVNGDLTVTGDSNITGTLTVGSFTVSNLSVTSSLIGPSFTATSTTATSSFAGGFYAKRIEAGDYLAGPYVLATSTTATSVFSGNIAANGNTTLGDASSDTLTINSSIDSSLIPSTTSTYDLGSSTRTWRNAYIDTILATNASSTYATSTTFSTTNFRLGSNLFTSLLGNGLMNASGVLSVSTSSLASGFFLQNGNSFGTTAVLGTNDAQGLQLETNNLPRITVDSSGNVGVGTSTPGSLLSLANIANFTTATSTFYATGGINLTGGCFAVNGTCVTGGGGGGSGTVNTGTAGQIAYYESNGTTVSATSSVFVSPTGNVGIGTTSPYAKLSVVGQAVAEYFTATSTTATSTFALAQITNALRFGSDYLTDLTGSGLVITAGALTLDRTGDWTGTLDGQEGAYYLARANHTGTQLASTISDFASTARGLFSSSATGLTYTSGTGDFSLTSGYVIPLTASTTEWNAAYLARITGATYPLQIASNVISLAFGTTTANTWGALQTFTSGFLSTASSTVNGGFTVVGTATSTNLAITGVTSSLLSTNASGQAQSTTVSSPLSFSGSTLSIQNAAADGTTKGAASFTAADFDATSGNISIDYTNGQAASASTKGFLIPADWSVFNNKVSSTSLSAVYPLTYNSSTGVFASALSTTTSNTWAGTQTFGNILTTNATTSSLGINSETFTDLTGTGLSNVGGALTLNATGDWTGTFDGQEGSYYLDRANHTGTQVASTISDFSAAVGSYISGSSTVPHIGGSAFGDLLSWTGSAWGTRATSTLGIALGDTTGTLGQARGGTGFDSYAAGDLIYADGSGNLTRLPIGNPSQVLKVTGGLPAWGADLTTGGGGGAGAWATTSDSLAVYPADTSDVVIVGNSATSTLTSIFEVHGKSYFSNFLGIGTTTASTQLSVQGNALFSGNLSLANLTATGTVTAGNLTLGSLTGPLQALNGVVSASSTISVAYGGTGSTTLTGILKGNGTGGILSALAGVDYENALSFAYPLVRTLNAISLAFGTTTSNTWAGTQTFGNILTTNATTSSLGINSETFTDLTGTGLSNVGGALTLNATGDWTGTFDGQEGSYYLDRANHTGTQAASTISDFDASVNAYIHASTTIPKAYTANTFTGSNIFSGGMTIGSLTGPLQALNGVVSASSTISVAYGGTGLSTLPSYGQILVGNSAGGYTLTATSSLGLSNYWSVSGSDIYNSTGTNVGIGTTTPAAKLGVAGDVYASGFFNTSGTTGGYKIDNQLVGYASSTNAVTVFGIGAGGQSATTSSGIFSNSAFGSRALSANTTGEHNTAIGQRALELNTVGGNNTAVGDLALSSNTRGSGNTVMGFNAAPLLATGQDNVVMGYEALTLATAATSTVAIGTQAGTGSGLFASQGSVYLGHRAGYRVSNQSDYNTFLGFQAGYLNTTGYNNIILGAQTNTTGAGYITTGDNNIGIGFNSRFPSATGNNQFNLGNFVFGTLPATSTDSVFRLPTTGTLSVGSSSSAAKFSIHANNGDTATTLFAIGSSTASATSTLFSVTNAGNAILSGTSTAAAGAFTGFALGADYLTDITGTGLTITAGVLNASVSGDWTGTFDGQEGSYYLDRANHTGTQAASTISDFDASVNAYIHASTTIPKAYTANTFTGSNIFSGGMTIGSLTGPLQALNGVVSASSTISVAYGGTGLSTLPSYGQILVGNAAGGYTLTATSSLGLGVTGAGTTGQFPYYAANGTTLSATSTLFLATTGNVGIGSTTPAAKLGVAGDVYASGFFNTSAITGGYKLDGRLLGYASSTHSTTIFGLEAGGQNATTSGTFRLSAFGYRALSANTTGLSNDAFGFQALRRNTTGTDNVAVGDSALSQTVTGSNNVAVGYQASTNNTSATATIAIGAFSAGSLPFNARGYTVIGYQAGNAMVTGSDYNTFLGYQSGKLVSTGHSNILIGPSTSDNDLTTGSGNIGIGNNTFFPSGTANNQLNIGGLVFGTLPATTTVFTLPTSGKLGVGTSSPYAKFSIQTNNGDTATTLFAIGSSTASATSTLFSVTNTGNAILSGTSTAAGGSFTGFALGADYLSDITGTGLSISGGSLNVNVTGDWTGTFDGQEGAYYLARANHTGTQAASTISDFNDSVNAYIHASTTIPKAYTANTYTALNTFNGGLTIGSLTGPLQALNGVVSATTSIGVLYGGTGLTSAPSYGQVLVGNGSGGYTLTATSSLGYSFFQQDGNSFANTATLGTNDDNALAFETNGTNRIFIENTGNVGIGNGSPASVVGYTVVSIGNATSGGSLSFQQNGTNRAYIYNSAGANVLNLEAAAGVNVTDGSNSRLYIDTATGNVGIGTSSPYARLSVAGQAVASYFTSTSTTVNTFPTLLTTNATTSSLGINSETFTDLTGTGLSNVGGALTLNATGDWTGTFDGQEGAYYLARANHTGTQAASTISDFDASVNAYIHASTTIPKAYTANTFSALNTFNGGLTIGSLTGPLQALNGVVSASSTISVAYGGTGLSTLPSYGQILVGNSAGGYTLTATSSLGLGTVGSGTTGQFPYYAANGTTLTATSSLSISTSGAVSVKAGSDIAQLHIGNFATLESKFNGDAEESLSLTSTESVDVKLGAGGFFNVYDSTDTFVFYVDDEGSVLSQGSGSFAGIFGVAGDTFLQQDALIGATLAVGTSTTPLRQVTIATSTLPQLMLADGSTSSNPYNFRSINGNLYIATSSPTTYATSSMSALTINTNGYLGIGTTTPGSPLSIGGIANFTTATSTLYGTGGINLTSGCFAVNGTCVGAAGGSGTVGSGTTGQFPYYAANGTTLTATSSIFLATSGYVGIGSTAPLAPLYVSTSKDAYTNLGDVANYNTVFKLTTASTGVGQGIAWSAGTNPNVGAGIVFQRTDTFSKGQLEFYIKQSNADAVAPILSMVISDSGRVGIGTSSPYAKLSVVGEVVASHYTATTTATSTFAGGLNVLAINQTGSASSTFANGINLASGCFAVNGTCVGSGSGSGTVGSGTTGQFPYYAANGTTLSATSTLFLAT
ncbi:MAG: hypothetical protein V4681_03795, partial [Patescibacteria group bacterium]